MICFVFILSIKINTHQTFVKKNKQLNHITLYLIMLVNKTARLENTFTIFFKIMSQIILLKVAQLKQNCSGYPNEKL